MEYVPDFNNLTARFKRMFRINSEVDFPVIDFILLNKEDRLIPISLEKVSTEKLGLSMLFLIIFTAFCKKSWSILFESSFQD